MYGTAQKRDNSSRVVGLIAVGVSFGLVALGTAFGVGTRIVQELTETEVVIIEEQVELEEEPPPPPPVDVDLPPPPPQVVLPEFTFDVPPPPNAIQQVEQVQQPVQRPPAPPPRPAVTIVSRPEAGRRATLPDYPAAARRAQEEGTTSLEMCVDANGRVTDIKIVGSSGSDRLDDAALRHWQRNRFTPAKNSNGEDVAICGHVLENVWSLENAR